jgi:toxin-antitoxin system PIN domain toxin
MFLPDVNVLLYAFRQDAPFHTPCKTWLEEQVFGDAPLAISPLTLCAVARITTNRRTYRNPSAIEEVFRYCNELRDCPNVRLVEPGESHWPIFQRICIDDGITGPMISDAWLAALAIEWNCEFVTMDRDFARFSKLRWRSPID